MACMRQMWPTHKRCCKEWTEQRNFEEATAPKDSEDAVDVATPPMKELKRMLDRLKISYTGSWTVDRLCSAPLNATA
ncbi:hypothetical protein T492DRAFT_860009 [Pavlovales sp. CCMP2436]|nr:hypothetical protein T492DRAFT_860009 [Pavlovales sp. CCMP2436]